MTTAIKKISSLAWASINKVSGVQLTGTNLYSAHLVAASSQAFSAVDHADLKPTGAFTTGFWIKSTSTSDAGVFQSWSQNAHTAGWLFRLRNGQIQFLSGKNVSGPVGTSYQIISSATTACNNGNWHWIVGTWDTAKIHLYIDNVEDANSPVTWANAPAYAASNCVRLGCANDDNVTDYWFTDGNVDEAFLINGTAWDLATVQSYYGKVITGATNLKAYYQLENGLTDSSGNSHTLTAIGSPTYSSDVPFTGIRVNKVAGVQN